MANMRREQARTGFDQPDWSAVMSKYAILGAALLAAALVTPASAQAVVEDPGYCAQFYPNANCQNYGPGNPMYGGYYPNSYARVYASGVVGLPVRPHRRHHR
jgi:hypothetical protein